MSRPPMSGTAATRHQPVGQVGSLPAAEIGDAAMRADVFCGSISSPQPCRRCRRIRHHLVFGGVAAIQDSR